MQIEPPVQGTSESRLKTRCAFRRPNPVFSEEYQALRDVIVEARKSAGLTQRQLAARLGKAGSHVNLIERGQRRVDALELYLMAKAFGVCPEKLFERIARRVEALQPVG